MATSSKVTWGPNTVNVFNTNNAAPAASAPQTSLFGATAWTPSPAPATPGYSAFSSQPMPIASPGVGLFSPTAAAPVAAPVYPAANAFSQVLGAPQQAALQAHMNATMHQEASSLGTQLNHLHAAFSPFQTQMAPTQQNVMCRFQHIFYDPITQAQRLEKLSLPNYPPKPNHISDEVWYRALTQNPDPEEYIPVLVTSAEGLHSRLVSQQSKMKLHEGYLTKLDETLVDREKFNQSITMQMEHYKRQNIQTRQRLQQIMRKFEMCRGKNVPLQEAEREAVHKLLELSQHVNQVAKMLEVVQREGEEYSRQWTFLQQERRRVGGSVLDEGVKEEAMGILVKHKMGVDEMVKCVKKSERDIEIMKNDGRPMTSGL